jgi:hypothetical protein
VEARPRQGPAAAELDAYLKAYWTGAALSDADHRKALESLEQSIAKAGEGGEALKLFMLLHASVLATARRTSSANSAYVKEGDRWGGAKTSRSPPSRPAWPRSRP